MPPAATLLPTWESMLHIPFCCNPIASIIQFFVSYTRGNVIGRYDVIDIFDNGTFYCSVDGGYTWKSTFTFSTFQLSLLSENLILKAAPNMEGEVWLSMGSGGLWKSSNYGESFTRLPFVNSSLLVAFG